LILAGVAVALLLDSYALRAPVLPDDSDGLERYSHSPLWFDKPIALFWAKDTPAVSRWVNYLALRLCRVEIGPIPLIDPNAGYEWNRLNNRLAPRGPVNFLRRLNVAAMVAAFGCLVLLGRTLFGGYEWGLALAAPLLLHRRVIAAVAGFIFADAYLMLLLSLMILVWVRHHLSANPCAWRRVLAMGVIGGLAVSTKYNAGLALLAYAAYLAIVPACSARFWRIAAFLGVSFAVFAAVNPIMWRGGPVWWGNVLYDAFVHRLNLIEYQRYILGAPGFLARFRAVLPYWYLFPIVAWLLWRARTQRWFLPVSLWAGFLVVGTLLTIHEPFYRYRMPVFLALTVIVTASVISILQAIRKPRRDVPVSTAA
jgi:hypothetical protein